jgi:nucleoside-diphosphate-sugar epimerase
LKTKTSIGILGCGWLGKATAKVLCAKGYEVKGSVTTTKGLEELKSIGVKPYVIKINQDRDIKNLEAFLKDLKVLVIAIPPKTSQSDFSLLNAMTAMFMNYDFSHLDKLIYISSTGVFKDGHQAVYNEDSAPNNTTDRGKTLMALEQLILGLKQIRKAMVLRYGGLIKQGGRHPVHYLSGRKHIANPKAPVNLIEQKDAVNLLLKIIEAKDNLNLYHGVCPWHPFREDYYVQKAKEFKLDLPEFEQDKASVGKIVHSDKTQNDLNFEYKSKI